MNQTDKDTIIMENMGLVKMVVNKHASRIQNNPSIDKEDLVNIGAIGLMKAYERFNPDLGNQFSTYAVPMIEGEIRRYFRDNLEPIKFSRALKNDYIMISEFELLNEQPEAIAEQLDISIKRVKSAIEYGRCRNIDSTEREIYRDDGEAITLGHTISEEVDFVGNLILEEMLNKLDEKTRQVVELRMDDLSQVEIGEIIGLSQVQVSRILAKAQKIMKGDKKVTKYSKEIIETNKVEKETLVDFTLAKDLAEETEYTPTQISNRTGVSYATAWNYINEYRGKSEEIKVEEITVDKLTPIEVKTEPKKEKVEIIEQKTTEKDISSYGHMAMTFEVGLGGASNRLEDIISAMKVLGFEGLKITIQGEQSA